MASTPFTVKWGILATGGIAQTFSKDLLTDPTARGTHDVRHRIVAAASSTSAARAAAFLKEVGAEAEARAYGSYAELVSDANVDIVYVATPHSHHFQNAMLALEAGGKPVLCEKAFTVTASQARALVATARAKKLFLMEAVWTRYFPLSVKVRELVAAGAIGRVVRVVADNSINAEEADNDGGGGALAFADTNRMVNLDLAGGALLDLGIYSLTWLFQILYHLQAEPAKEAPRVVAALSPYARTGADENTTVVLQFPRHGTQGIALTALRTQTGVDMWAPASPAILIQGTRGEIQIDGPAFKPTRFRLVTKADAGFATKKTFDYPTPQDARPGAAWKGHGMFWEADEAARCLRDGRLESPGLPLDESVVIMEAMDEALRQGGIRYPAAITSDVYSKDSPLNTGKA